MEDSKLSVTDVARVAHEVQRTYCMTQGDNSETPWESQSEYWKEKAQEIVREYVTDPNAGINTRHDAWYKSKVAEGWTYGDDLDVAAKKSTRIMPWHFLPAEEQMRDMVFFGVVNALKVYLK